MQGAAHKNLLLEWQLNQKFYYFSKQNMGFKLKKKNKQKYVIRRCVLKCKVFGRHEWNGNNRNNGVYLFTQRFSDTSDKSITTIAMMHT